MRAKEKAKDLVNKYLGIPIMYGMDEEAKTCALIAVDELLGEYSFVISEDCHESRRWDYWKEVKEEINKL